MSNLKIEELTPQSKYIEEVYLKYKDRFGQYPWDEVSKCPTHGFSDLPVGTICGTCGVNRTEAYPKKETIAKIKKELSYTGAIGKIAIIDGVVAAFNWGFQSTPTALSELKWDDCSEGMRNTVVQALQLYANQLNSIFYLAECVTAVDFENKKLQKLLVTEMRDQVNTNIPWAVRTNNKQTAMVRICEYTLGLTRVVDVGQDEGYPDRVLYAGYAQR